MTEEKLEQEDGWGDPIVAPSQEADDWGNTPEPAPLTLSMDMHQGAFDTEHTKYLIYGESGAYKSRTASTFPKPVFVDIDHGLNSVTEKVGKFYIDDDERGLEQMRAVHQFLLSGDHDRETVILDTLNEMQRGIMQFTIEKFTTVRRSYDTLPGMSDYGYMLNQFTNLWRDFLVLPMRVVFLAQVNSQQFDTDILMPQLIGKNTAREISRKMDVIGYIYKTEQDDGNGHKVPAIAFDAPNYVTKDRSGKLPGILESPSYDRIAAFWK